MISPRVRALSAVAALAAAALLAACSSAIPGIPVPTSSGAATSSGQATFRGCTITAAGSNISSRSNVGISTISSNDGTRINCGGAGQLSLIDIGDSEIVVGVGDARVTVASGETTQVGPYQVAVQSVTNGTAMFTMAPSR